MVNLRPSLTDAEYTLRRRGTRREEFLTMMDQIIPWQEWTDLIAPSYDDGKKGRKPVRLETILRLSLLYVWFNLSDEGVDDHANDSSAMRSFMTLDYAVEQVPDATTLLHVRHLMEADRHSVVRCAEPVLRRPRVDHAWRECHRRDDHLRPLISEEPGESPGS